MSETTGEEEERIYGPGKKKRNATEKHTQGVFEKNTQGEHGCVDRARVISKAAEADGVGEPHPGISD